MSSRLAVAVAGVAVVLTGCFGGGPPGDDAASTSATVVGDPVTLVPGQTATLTVEATNVGELWISTRPQSDAVRVDVRNATLSPRPSQVAETFPPFWGYDRVEPSVTLRVPVTAAADAAAGTYTVGVTALNSTDHNHDDGVEGTVSVEITSPESGPDRTTA
jgi:hypothetical protein